MTEFDIQQVPTRTVTMVDVWAAAEMLLKGPVRFRCTLNESMLINTHVRRVLKKGLRRRAITVDGQVVGYLFETHDNVRTKQR